MTRTDAVAQIMQATESSTTSKRPQQRARSSPPRPGAAPSRSDGDLAGVIGAYLEVFSRPPLGDHPEMDGFVAGRVLAEEYPDTMQQVMEGFREGVKEGTEAAERPRGQSHE